MKKILCFILFASPIVAPAQWATSGSNIHNTNSGNVGIGTASPKNKLELGLTATGGISLGTNETPSAIGTMRFVGTTGMDGTFNGGKIVGGDNGAAGIAIINTTAGSGLSHDLGFYTHLGGIQSSQKMIIKSEGNIGIGTISPNQKLTIKGGGIGFDGNSVDKKLYASQDGVLEWVTHDMASEHGFAVSHQGAKRIFLNTLGDSYIIGGNLGIGTTNPQSKLSVNGDIFSKKIKVTQTGWPDYVFAPQYKLPSLQEVEVFIKRNHHLPGVSSAQKVAKEGLDLGETQAALLTKIEELTLYVIDINKRLLQQQMLIEEQAKQLKRRSK